jgi:hypothetical protein
MTNAIAFIRRMVPALLVAALLMVASCTATKQYGCPDSLRGSGSSARAAR